jgi:hypothetical protein
VSAGVADYPQVESRYAHMSKGELISALEAHDRTLQGIYSVIHLDNEKMGPGEKLYWIGARCILPDEKPNADGLVRLPHDKIADFIGMSRGSANRYGNALIERFDATKVPVDYTTLKGQECKLTYINRDEPVWQEPWSVDLPEEKERIINGNGKRCPVCKTNNLQVTTRRLTYQEIQECDCCGYRKISGIRDDKDPLPPGEYIPTKKGPQAEEPFEDEDITVDAPAESEKGPQAEEPLACENEKAQKSASLTNPVTPPCAEKVLQPEEPFGFDDGAFLTIWLKKRIGVGQMARHTGNLTPGEKYRCLPVGYDPDIQAYLAGALRHVYASQLNDEDGLSWILAGDIDGKRISLLTLMRDLAKAGIASAAWRGRPGRWHIETYWSERVNPQAAHNRLLRAAPLWAEINEVFPIHNGKTNRINHRLGWPLYHRIDDKVIPRKSLFMFPDNPGKAIRHPGIVADREGLAVLIERCLTPSSLIEECDYPQVVRDETRCGGALLDKYSPRRDLALPPDDENVSAAVLAQFRIEHPIEGLVDRCGGLHHGKFAAVWRPTSGITVLLNADGWTCHDFGEEGIEAFKSHFDGYDLWCFLEAGRNWGVFKRADWDRRCAEYRKRHMSVPSSAMDAAPPASDVMVTEPEVVIADVMPEEPRHPTLMEMQSDVFDYARRNEYPPFQVGDISIEPGLAGWRKGWYEAKRTGRLALYTAIAAVLP